MGERYTDRGYAGHGLTARSVIRAAKLSTIFAPLATKIGRVDPVTRAAALDFLANGPRP